MDTYSVVFGVCLVLVVVSMIAGVIAYVKSRKLETQLIANIQELHDRLDTMEHEMFTRFKINGDDSSSVYIQQNSDVFEKFKRSVDSRMDKLHNNHNKHDEWLSLLNKMVIDIVKK